MKALGHAARYVGQRALSLCTFSALGERHHGTDAARRAAFFLGRRHAAAAEASVLVKQSLVRVQGELSAVGLGAMYGSVGRRNATDAPTILIAEKRVITLDRPPFVISLGGKHRRVLKKTSSLGGVHRSPFLMSSVSNAVAMGQMQISVAKMQLENVEQQGRNALTLIHASAPPEVVAAAATAAPANAGPGVGERLNVVA